MTRGITRNHEREQHPQPCQRNPCASPLRQPEAPCGRCCGIVAAAARRRVVLACGRWAGWTCSAEGARPKEDLRPADRRGQAPTDADAPRAYRDLRKPDALIESVSLSRLPRRKSSRCRCCAIP
ncbi:DUF2138 family protein [Pseudomonas aeruginosa]